MPRYELCYILSSQVSDDLVPETTAQIKKFIEDFGGTEIEEQQLGKKKLAYPIKKTRNGFYVVERFNIESTKINDLDAKIRSQTATVIRYLIINLDEHLERLEKDKIAQAKLPKREIPEGAEEKTEAVVEVEEKVEETKPVLEEEVGEVKETPKTKIEISSSDLDKKIEEALNQQI